METFTQNELKTLTEKQKSPCVSIFMPTHRVVSDIREDQIKLKNLLRSAEESLLEYGLRIQEAKLVLKSGEGLLKDMSFWQHQRDGLVLFLSPELFRYYLLPSTFEELVVVTDRFHLKPLLSLLSNDGQFYILALSKNEVRLFQCSRLRIDEIDLKEIPQGIGEALKYDDPEKQLQFHTQTQGAGKRPAMFHGHGVGKDDKKDNIKRYFRQIDKGVYEFLKEEQIPLILAGVEYLFPIYREVNTYPHLVEEGITGNPERLSVEELHMQGGTIIQTYFHKKQQEAITDYRKLSNTGKTSNNIKKIIRASYHGRVELLFVAVGLQQWGTFDPDKNIAKLHSEEKPGDEDMLDFAAVQTLLHGGTVYAVKPQEVPNNSPIVAVLRY
jgi:hypothetical protein